MAAKPSSTPLWATGGTFTSGDQIGDDIILEPTLAYKMQGNVPGRGIPARFLNWWMNLAYQWMEYLKDGLFSGGVVACVDGPVRARSAYDYEWCDAAGATTTKAVVKMLPLLGFYSNNGNFVWTLSAPSTAKLSNVSPSTSDFVTWTFTLPKNAVLTQIRLGVTQAVAATTDKIQVKAFRVVHGKSEPFSHTVTQFGSTTYLDGATGDDVITLIDTAQQTAGSEFVLQLRASDGGTDPGPEDQVHWIEVSFNDPGPRND